MKLISITTPYGAALLADLSDGVVHGVTAPQGYGVVFWGRCDRVTFGQTLLASSAEWIADYSMSEKLAIIIGSSRADVVVGSEFTIDTTAVDALCPQCGSTHYTSNGALNWKCKDCGFQWRKNPKPRGGAGRGQGRKTKEKNDETK